MKDGNLMVPRKLVAVTVITVLILTACSNAGTPSKPATGSGQVSTLGSAVSGGATVSAPVSTLGSAVSGGATVSAPVSTGSAPEPLVPALTARGKAEVKPGVAMLAGADVRGISTDGARFLLTSSAAQNLKVGSIFVVRGVASRKVTAIQPQGDVAAVDTEQATVDDLFSDLDVTFDGSPDLSAAVIGGTPAIAKGGEPEAEVNDNPDEGDTASQTASSTLAPTTTGLRNAASSAFDQCRTGEFAQALSVGDLTVTPSYAHTADCKGLVVGAEITGSKGKLTMGMSLKSTIKVGRISGSVKAGISGSGQSATVNVTADGGLSGSAKANQPGGVVKRYKVSWDLLKEDFPVDVYGIPFVVRIGIPFIVEPRFSGGVDSISGHFVNFHCQGVIGVGGDQSSTDQSVCTMAAATVSSLVSLAPTGLVLSIGLKIGFGPGIVLDKKAIAFGGFYGTMAFSVGISGTGAASAGLLDCVRVDRTKAYYTGVELVLGKFGTSSSVPLFEKTDTNQLGSRCPNK